ncbi:MAG: hypothetical protein PHE24_02335 [Patescibacteria group bacterium]|nr:hypothetical protein [Patescibacteria group bacterium]
MPIRKGSCFITLTGAFVKIAGEDKKLGLYSTKLLRPEGASKGGVFPKNDFVSGNFVTRISAKDSRLMKLKRSLIRKLRAVENF